MPVATGDDAGPGDAGPADAGAVADAGPADAGGLAGGSPDAGASCPVDLHPNPDSCPANTPPDTSAAVCRTVVPDLPAQQLLDGGIPGPCEETDYDADSGGIARHFLQTFDAQGRQRSLTNLDAAGNVVSQTANQYDPCGRLVYTQTTAPDGTSTFETDYGADGLLARRAAGFAGPDGGIIQCDQQQFAWQVDETGQPDAEFDGVTCAPLAQYVFGSDGRLISDETADGLGFPFRGNDHYTYLPDGGVQQLTSTHQGFAEDETFDDQGLVIATVEGSNEPGEDLITTGWQRDDQGRVLRFSQSIASPGRCNTFRFDDVFTYDAGVLVSDAFTYTPRDLNTDCGSINTSVTSYSHPSPDVQVAQEMNPDGSTKDLKKTTFDSRGNVLSVDIATPPDFAWRPLQRFGYSCFDH